MGDTTMEQKLALVQQVRSSYNRNQYDLTNRERILYGKTSARSYSDMPYKNWAARDGFPEYGMEAVPDEMNTGISFFKLRFLLAAVLLAAVILLDINGGTIAGISAGELFDAISHDITAEIDTWLSD